MVNPGFILKDISQLPDAAKWLIKAFNTNRHIAFYGELGAGKTTLIKEICRQLGVIENVTSPTFALVNEYRAAGTITIFHFDFYRIDDPVEALDIGFEDYLSSGEFCFMEWPERVEAYLPSETIKVNIEVQSDNSRIVNIEFPA